MGGEGKEELELSPGPVPWVTSPRGLPSWSGGVQWVRGGGDGRRVFFLLFISSLVGCSGVLGLGMYSLGSFLWGAGQT